MRLKMYLMRPTFFFWIYWKFRKNCVHWNSGQSGCLCRAHLPRSSQLLDPTWWWFNLVLNEQFGSTIFASSCAPFTSGLLKWPDFDKYLKWVTLIWKNGVPRCRAAVEFVWVIQHLKFQNDSNLTIRFWYTTLLKFRQHERVIRVEELWQPHFNVLKTSDAVGLRRQAPAHHYRMTK